MIKDWHIILAAGSLAIALAVVTNLGGTPQSCALGTSLF
jgi:hypothetical protein